MYKVDLKTLNEITATIDALTNTKPQTFGEFIELRTKARKLSQKIKDNYTKIKK
jgi:hypothetical protein